MPTQYDLLTGFRTWSDFKENADSLYPVTNQAQIVATCDINSLEEINQKYGRTCGDLAFQRLAEELRSEFPAGTVFTRSREAALAAITADLDLYLEHRLRRKDGSAIFVYCYGHIFYDSSVGRRRARISVFDCDDPFGDRK